jgi:CheY-like chemotaxis protein
MGKKILIIDDDQDVILFLTTVLRDQGYQVLEARNGEEGLMRVNAEEPDLVLLDLMMPKKSGISLLSDMKGDDKLRHIPVIMVTGVAAETGIDLPSFLKKDSPKDDGNAPFSPEGYIEKPIDPEKLITLIKEIID